jgi:ketosteroid isomerase-like protein
MVDENESLPMSVDVQSEERELKLANEEWARALAQKDRDALERIMADEFELAYPFEGDDKAQFISDVVEGVVTVASLTPHSATTRVSGNTGLIFGSETANWRYRDRDLSGTYRFLRVYTRQEGQWRILALHLCTHGQH